MNTKKIFMLFALLFFANTFLPVSILAQESAPSKYVMKKDGDGDGVKNKRDKCPTTPPGIKVDGYGCPLDLDKDGVPDYLDKCPDLPGLAELNGCQDKDTDGVSDFDDACPDVPGIGRFMGCPDSDGDGIEDKKDKCPNAKGLDRFLGCADTDGDGVEDTKDKCANTKAGVVVDSKGCPADTDMDGVMDSEDKCPYTISGVKVDATGCPADNDSDGILNVFDKCPDVKGDAANYGCPAKVAKRLNFAVRKISFESKNALVKTTSYPMLDEVANILKEYPDYNIRIGGHADGLESKGDVLSQSRADAVRSYLLSKGVADSRMITSFYGKTRPVVSNATAALRTQNRRVEIELYVR